MPYLLREIDTFNNRPTTAETDKINLKGMMVGNGVTNWVYDTMPATLDFSYWRSIMSQDLFDEMAMNKCNYSYVEFPDQ